MSITPNQSRVARESLGLSQSAIAKGCGLNRSYLSQWECENKILPDAALIRLRRYLEEQGYKFPDDEDGGEDSRESRWGGLQGAPKGPEQVPVVQRVPEGTRVVDGFLVPRGLRPGLVENLLDELERVDALIAGWLANDAEVLPLVTESFWNGEEVDDSAVRLQAEQAGVVLGLMARWYLLVKRLRGEAVDGLERVVLTTGRVVDADEVDDSDKRTNAGFLSVLLEESDQDPGSVELPEAVA